MARIVENAEIAIQGHLFSGHAQGVEQQIGIRITIALDAVQRASFSKIEY